MTARAGTPNVAWGPRRLLVAVVAAAIAAAAGLALAPSGGLASPGPLARPHAAAGVKCGSCHGERANAPATSEGCVSCHAPHPSTRPAHRALASRGALGCPTCHTAHGGSEGVTFASSGQGARWKGEATIPSTAQGPPGATVPLVTLSACAACHDLSRADDPVQACVAAGGVASIDQCFDEHERPGSPLASRGRCAHEHGEARFLAWEAARRVVEATPTPRLTKSRAPWLWVGSGMGAGGLAFAGAAGAHRLRRRRGRTPAPVVPVGPARVRLPRIDASRCLGCHACVDVCPFDVLTVDKHVAVVARPEECCGVAACESACPNGSLTLATEEEPIADRPRVDEHLESRDRPGLFLAGDLTGVPLIRSAIGQGTRVAERIAAGLPKGDRWAGAADQVDLVVVGAGPAGLAAALRARELGLSCTVLEQWTTAATIRAFPRGKIVHDPPLELPLEGPLWLRESTKEELVAQWARIVRAHRLDVREHHEVSGVSGEAGAFVVSSKTPSGMRTVRACRVLLATGRRGTPRTLEVEVGPRVAGQVSYTLSDAGSLAGKRVLIVGLGDSAMEAAVALARQPGTTVTISYRGTSFRRGRARNIDEVRRMADSGRVHIAFESQVVRMDEGGAWLRYQGREAPERIRVDVVLALLGGEPARGLLDAAGVRFEGG
jgi:thioredoxin reductase/NAD-dependent dihydropyrimidine dehydrogenase PreA subunit